MLAHCLNFTHLVIYGPCVPLKTHSNTRKGSALSSSPSIPSDLAVSCCEAGAFYLCLLCTCPLSLLHVPMPHFSTRLNLASPGPRSGGASRKPSLHVLALPCHYDSLCLPGPELFAALIHLISDSLGFKPHRLHCGERDLTCPWRQEALGPVLVRLNVGNRLRAPSSPCPPCSPGVQCHQRGAGDTHTHGAPL